MVVVHEVSKVYCQIEGRDITGTLCEGIQGQEGCIGCGASSRRCEKCEDSAVEVPMAGMCRSCLAIERIEALEVSPKIPERVTCQIMKRSISSAMCDSMQGQEECHGCPAPTRKCTVCGNRPPHTAKFGLCLECVIEEFAPDLENEPEEKKRKPVEPQRLAAPLERLIQKYGYLSADLLVNKEKLSASVAHSKIRQALMSGAIKEGNGGLYVRATGVVVQLTDSISSEADELPKGRKALLQKARTLIMEHHKATVSLLVKNLGISPQLGKSLMDVLVHEGLISVDDSGARRRYMYILREPTVTEAPTAPLPTTTRNRRLENAELLVECARIVGEDSTHGKQLLEIRSDLLLLEKLDRAIREILGE